MATGAQDQIELAVGQLLEVAAADRDNVPVVLALATGFMLLRQTPKARQALLSAAAQASAVCCCSCICCCSRICCLLLLRHHSSRPSKPCCLLLLMQPTMPGLFPVASCRIWSMPTVVNSIHMPVCRDRQPCKAEACCRDPWEAWRRHADICPCTFCRLHVRHCRLPASFPDWHSTLTATVYLMSTCTP